MTETCAHVGVDGQRVHPDLGGAAAGIRRARGIDEEAVADVAGAEDPGVEQRRALTEAHDRLKVGADPGALDVRGRGIAVEQQSKARGRAADVTR